MKTFVAALAALTVTFAIQGHASGEPTCSVSWVGGTDNRWETGANWSTGEEPTGLDDVCITAPGTDVVLERGVSVNSLTVGTTLRVTARSSSTPLYASAGITVENGGVIDVTSTGAFASSLNGGTVTNHGTMRLLAGAGGNRLIAAPVVNRGLLQVTANATIDGGGNATTTNSGTLAVADQGSLTVGATDTLRLEGGEITGTVRKQAGTVELATDPGESLPGKVLLQGATVVTKGSVPAGLTLQVQTTAAFQPLTGEAEATNRGTILLDAGAGLSGLPLVNEGTIRLTGAGTRSVSTTLENRGALTVAAGTTLDLPGSRTLKQHGTLTLDGSLIAVDDTIEIADPRLTSTAPIALGGTSTLRFGLAPGTPLDARFTLTGAATHVGGDVPAQTTLRVLGDTGFTSPTTTNRGTIVLDATSEIGGGSLVNQGTLTVAGPGVDAVYAGSGPLVNRGELTVHAGSSLALAGAQTLRQEGVWNQHGSFTADGDTIEIADPRVTSTQELGITAGSTLRFALDPGVALPAAFRVGDGTSYVEGDLPSGATLRVLATASFRAHLGSTTATNRGTIALDSSGRLAGLPLVNRGTVRVTAPDATAHTLDNTADGSLVVEPGAQLDLDTLASLSGTTLGGGLYDIAGRLRVPSADVRTNAATLVLRDGGELVDGALRNLQANTGTLSLVGSALAVSGDLENSGTVRVDAGSLLDAPGGFYTQTGGLTELAGTLAASRVNVDGGTLAGSGTIDGDLRNAATLAPGTLHVTRGFTQAAGGTLRMRVDGATSASRLVAAGASTLGGTLSVVRDGGYAPALGDTAELVSAPLSGAFATVDGLGTGRPRHVLDATSTAVRVRWADLPGAPGGVTATGANRSATIRWTAAAPNGDAVDGYTITAHPVGGGADVRATAGAAARTATLAGLVNGTAYDVTVTASNGVGDGAASGPARVTPADRGPTAAEPPTPVAEPPAPVAELLPTPVAAVPPADQPTPSEPPRAAIPSDARAAATAALRSLVTQLAAAGPARLAKGILATFKPAQPGLYKVTVSMRTPRKKRRKPRLVLLASGKGSLGQVRIRPTARGRTVLRRAKSLKVIVRATFTPAGGRAATAERRLTLRAKRRKGRGRSTTM